MSQIGTQSIDSLTTACRGNLVFVLICPTSKTSHTVFWAYWSLFSELLQTKWTMSTPYIRVIPVCAIRIIANPFDFGKRDWKKLCSFTLVVVPNISPLCACRITGEQSTFSSIEALPHGDYWRICSDLKRTESLRNRQFYKVLELTQK